MMRTSAAFLFVVLLLSQSCTYGGNVDGPRSTVLIMAVHPGGSSDWEHVILVNTGNGPMNISGWTLSDGEGTLSIPEDSTLLPGIRTAVAHNASAFQILWSTPPDLIAERRGSFVLADKGDSLALLDPSGAVIDQLCYGITSDPSPVGWSGDPVTTPSSMPWGRLLQRGNTEDTDTALDWTGWWEPRCGWLDQSPSREYQVNATTFTTPDGGWSALSWAISSAEEDLSIAIYDLSSRDLAAVIADRASNGVRTRVLVEDRPVGETVTGLVTRDRILAALAVAGVEVWLTRPSEKGVSHAPYLYHHEKYCIVDDDTIVVTTENWCPTSFPPGGDIEFGSRGWGAIIVGEGPVSDLEEVFENDLTVSAVRWEPEDVEPIDLPDPVLSGIVPPSLLASKARVMMGPELWGGDLAVLVDIIGGAKETILLELAYLQLWWGHELSPLVEALLSVATRGVDVRLVLDPGVEGEGRGTLEDLHLLAAQRGATGIRGVLASNLSNATRLHAKGAIIDGRTAVLGSLNWAWSSVARNREVVVVVESRDAVWPLVETFGDDWNASMHGMAPSVPRSLVLQVLSRWQGRSFPHRTLQPFDQDGTETREVAPRGEAWWKAWARVAVILALLFSLRAMESRYGLTARASMWIEDRLGWVRGVLFRSGRRPSSGEEAPDAPRTICPEPVPVQGAPPSSPPPKEPPPPPRRPPRVVVLPLEE
jgi:phosphatidylserine/phosphatidylglycerophosphate/cardiolipin synthase-like enzyme